ncbi:hypothetical protein, partial [Spirulina sp.]|uniref:hypothetical protein n=1 Tax=Spirulina sp. TaxID=1157 RepID=UPI003F7057FF
SAVTAAFALCIYLVIELFFYLKTSLDWPQKLILLTIGGLSFAIPPALLSLINQSLTQTVNIIEQSELSGLSPDHPRGWYMILFILAVPTLYLFQGMFLWMHFVFFSDSWLSFFSDIVFQNRIIPLAILVLPMSAAIAWLIWHYRHHFNASLLRFAACVGLIPIFPLAYLSNRIGYNYLIFNPRHGSYHFIIVEMIILSVLLYLLFSLQENYKKHRKRYWAMLLLLVVFPNSFHAFYFFKDYFLDTQSLRYVTGSKHIRDINVSFTKTPIIFQKSQSLIQNSQQDITVLALDAVSSFSSWLIVNGRVLPLVNADESFVTSHGRTMNIHGKSPLLTTKNLRVVLVVSHSIEADQIWLQTLKDRFPQATDWQKLPDQQLPESKVAVYFTDLVVAERDSTDVTD